MSHAMGASVSRRPLSFCGYHDKILSIPLLITSTVKCSILPNFDTGSE